MDRIIQAHDTLPFNDLLDYCPDLNMVLQRDTTQSITYDQKYFDDYVAKQNTEISLKINVSRCEITNKYCKRTLIDIGIGSGEFITKSSLKVYGYDINPLGVQWLKERNLFVDIYNETISDQIEGWTLWDVMEHIPEPSKLFDLIGKGKYVFISMPIFNDFKTIEKNKHYKPNEHYYYFSHDGLIRYLREAGFGFIESNDNETKAGRFSIETFVFQKETQ